MKVAFCRSNTISSWAVRFLTWSPYSHCVLVAADGTTVEAVWPRVKASTLSAVLADNGTVHLVDFPCADPASALDWARLQVGRPYDWRAILGFVFHRDWADPHEWFCSEFVAEAFAEGGSPLLRPGALGRVTPQDLWMLPGVDL